MLTTLTPDSDAWVAYANASGVSWSTIRTSAGTSLTASPLRAAFRRRTPPNFLSGDRTVIVFDTSFIGSSEILSATLRVYGNNKTDDYSNAPTINVYAHTPGDIDNLASSDYNIARHGSTAFSTTITYAGFNASGWNTFVLNASGVSHINTSGKTAFSIREAKFDVGNTTPTVVATTESFQGFAFDADSQTNPPELIIETPDVSGQSPIFFRPGFTLGSVAVTLLGTLNTFLSNAKSDIERSKLIEEYNTLKNQLNSPGLVLI